jgi:hypothetical protein
LENARTRKNARTTVEERRFQRRESRANRGGPSAPVVVFLASRKFFPPPLPLNL